MAKLMMRDPGERFEVGWQRRRAAAILVLLIALVASAQSDDPKEPLCRAAFNGDFAQVRSLLSLGANPNVRDEQDMTPLMRVASAHERSALDVFKNVKHDYEGVAKLLIDKGAGVDVRDTKGRTALLLAMEGSASEYRVIGADEGVARVLIEGGADLNAHDAEGWTPLLNVLNLWADQPGLIELLIAKGANVKAQLNDGRTGLMLAAHLGKDERLQPLIAKGAEVNARDHGGATALMIAATVRWDEQSFKILKLLTASGATLDAVDNQGKTAADRAAEAGYIERAKLLVDSGTKLTDPAGFMKQARNYALLLAIDRGNISTARTMLEEGADPNFRDGAGRTLLMIAANEELSAERAILLLEHGASTKLTAPNGDTALMVAADRYQPEIVKALLDRGADPNAFDREGNSVLMRAAASKYSWQEERKLLIQHLLEKGADPRRGNIHGMTALMLMAREGNPALELVLEKGVDVDARDEAGNTALLHAARFFARGWPRRNGWSLLGRGADVNAANKNGETALILASTQFEADAVQLLLQSGAHVNAKTKAGRTALMQAIDEPLEFDNENHVVYSPEIAKLLISAGADVDAKDNAGNSALSIARKRVYEDMVAILNKAGAK
jgi:ankyrin repeat protein